MFQKQCHILCLALSIEEAQPDGSTGVILLRNHPPTAFLRRRISSSLESTSDMSTTNKATLVLACIHYLIKFLKYILEADVSITETLLAPRAWQPIIQFLEPKTGRSRG
jgi:hypothetical protein